jgi:predicted nuclease of predicted toxin-antitoxin system
MYLLIDECCSPGLLTVAVKAGHAAQLTREVAELGPAADDDAIFAFARRHEAVLVTVNAYDFRDLARYRDHAGVIIVPSIREPRQSRLFRAVLPVAVGVFGSARSRFVEIDLTGHVRQLASR